MRVLELSTPAPSTTPEPVAGWRQGLRESVRPVGIWGLSRVVVFLMVSVAGMTRHVSISHILKGWDAKWYLDIARHGYVTAIPPGIGDVAQSNLGFFPLMPLWVRTVHALTPLTWVQSGIAAAALSGLGASVAVWWLLRNLLGRRGADRGTMLVMLSPAAFVLSYVYSEGLFVMFVALSLLLLQRRSWILAGLAAGFATACDPVACAVIIPCVVASYDAIRERKEWRSLFAPLLAPLGVGSFFLYLWAHTGSPFEWFHAQRVGWQRGYYFTGVPKAFIGMFTSSFTNLNPMVKSLSFFVGIVLLVLFIKWRPPRTWVGYVATVFFFGVFSPIVGVTPRLLLRSAPLLGYVGAKANDRLYPWLLTGSTVALCFLSVAASMPRWTP